MQPNGQRVSYATSAARGLAITQLVLGVLCLICGIAAMAVYWRWVTLYTGSMEIWMPISFIVAGILGIVASSQCSTGMIVAHMAMSIIAAVFAFSLFVDACVYAWLLYTHIPIAILSFAELVIAIISAAFCCRAVCCRTQSASGGVVVAGQPQGGTVVVTSGQHVVYAQQPVVYQQHYVAQPGVQYAPPGQYVVQPGVQQQMPPQYGVQQQMPPQQYGVQQQMPPQQYPQATGQATAPIETKPPEYAAQPTY